MTGRLLQPLSLRLTLFLVLPLAIVVLVGGALVLRALEGSFERRLQREVEMVARALRLPVGDAVRTRSARQLERSLESALSIGRVYGAHVYNENGELAASVGHGAERAQPSSSEGDGRTGGYAEVAGKQIYSYFVPLIGAGEEVIGTLQVTRKKEDFREFMSDIRVRGAWLLVGGAFVTVLIALLGYQGALGRSLAGFASSIQRVESGERDHRASVERPREVAAVARSFNSMLDSIAAAEERVQREQQSRRALEAKLRQSERLAAIGRLGAGVAHELGSPLSVVDGHAQRALRGDLSPELRQSLLAVRDQVARMGDLVRQLLDYGRSEPRARSWVSVERVVAAASGAVEPEAAARGVEIERSGGDEIRVLGNEMRLGQALVNLARNAVQAAKRRARLSWRARAGRVELVVDDDGPGVPASASERLYEPFFTTREAEGGTGLGLAITHSIAMEHGGSVHHKRSPMGGARFVLDLAADPGDGALDEQRPDDRAR